MAEEPKTPAAAGPRKGVPRPAEVLSDIGSGLGAIGDAVSGAVGRVIDPEPLRRQREGLPLQEPKPQSEEDVAAAAEVQRQQEQGNAVRQRSIGGFNAQMAVPGYNELVGGGAEPQQIGSRTVSRNRSAATPEQLQGAAGAIDYEARAWGAQYDAKAAGMGLLSNAYQDLALDQQEKLMPIVQEAERIFDDAQKQLVGIQEMADDVRANRINPGQFFANIGEAGTFAASMAVAAGHLASAMGGGPNTALGVVTGAIERNMRSQALNQAHDRAVLNSEIAIFDRLRGLGVDRLNQANVYNGLMISMAQSNLESISAATASVELRAQIGIVQAQLAQKKQEMFMRAEGTIQATTQMKLYAHRDAAQQAAKPSALQIFSNIVQEQASGDERGPLTTEQQKQQGEQIAARFREEQQLAGVSASPAELQQILNTGAFPGMDSNLLRPIEEGQGIGVVDRKTGETQTFVPTAQFESTFTSPELRKKALEGFRAEASLVQDWTRLHELAESVISTSGSGGTVSGLLGSQDGRFVIKGSPSATKDVYEMERLLNRITVQTKRAQSGGHMEAVHGKQEYEMFKVQANLPTDASAIAAAVLGGTFTDQITPGLEMAWNQFEEGWAPMMSGVQVQ